MAKNESKRIRVKAESFSEISKRKQPERVLRRKYRQKLAIGFLKGLKTLLGPGHVVVDCGANIGEITKLLAPTGAEIHSFEPDPFSFSKLQENCGHFQNVTMYNKAVGVGTGSIKIYRKKNFGTDPEWYSLTTTTVPDPKFVDKMEAIDVESIDLKEFLVNLQKQEKDVAFLKMDIEGGELEILEQLVQTDILTKIQATAVETHPWLFPDGRKRFSALKGIAANRPDFNLDLDWY